jgi:hypothetical protein
VIVIGAQAIYLHTTRAPVALVDRPVGGWLSWQGRGSAQQGVEERVGEDAVRVVAVQGGHGVVPAGA